MTTKESNGESGGTEPAVPTKAEPANAAKAESTQGWPELEQLVESVKTKRAEEITRQEEQRNAAQRATQEAQKAWAAISAQQSLEEMAQRLTDLGVTARPAETLPGTQSAALELSRLPKGEAATIRIDTTPSRSGPPRTTVQVQRGNQQMSPITLNANTGSELRKTLVEIAQKLLG